MAHSRLNHGLWLPFLFGSLLKDFALALNALVSLPVYSSISNVRVTRKKDLLICSSFAPSIVLGNEAIFVLVALSTMSSCRTVMAIGT